MPRQMNPSMDKEEEARWHKQMVYAAIPILAS